jgi:hypothetical protein
MSRPAQSDHRPAVHKASFALLAALVLCAPLSAQDPAAKPQPPKPQPVEPPLFNLLGVTAPDLAVLSLGVAAFPQTGPFGLCGLIAEGADPDLQLWSLDSPQTNRRGQAQIGAVTLFLNGAPGEPASLFARAITELVYVHVGHEWQYWRLFDTAHVKRLDKALLLRIRDSRPIPDIDSGDLEVDAWVEALICAARTPTETFFQEALDDVTYAHLFNEPKKYRGEPVRLSGRLKRVRRYDAPLSVQGPGNIRYYYEGWVFDDIYGANPFCILFTELPPGVQVGEKMDVPVEFAGYFFKKYRYRAGDNFKSNERRDVPMLIGHGLHARPPQDAGPGDTEWGKQLLPIFLGLIVATALAVVGLGWWMRRGDQAVKRRLSLLQPTEFIPPAPDAPPVPASAGAPVAQPVARSALRATLPGNGHPTHPTPQSSPQPSRLGSAGSDPEKPPDPSAAPRPGEERVPPSRGAANDIP